MQGAARHLVVAQVCCPAQPVGDRVGVERINHHDLGVVAETAQRVVVMYAGNIVEEASVGALFEEPLHPYTQGLIRSIPRIDLAASNKRRRLVQIPGTVPALRGQLRPCCRFAPRCPLAEPSHFERTPRLHEVRPDHKAACFLYD